jgi:hypothetical protein
LERTDDLVDHAAIADHQNRINVAAERLSVANALQRQEQAAYNAADAAYKSAVAGRGGDRHKCKIVLDLAATRLLVETEAADAARTELAHLHGLTDTVRAIAHVPVHAAYMRALKEDVKRLEPALAVVAGIRADIKASIAGIRALFSIGLPDIRGMLEGDFPETWRDLKVHWTSRGIDPDDPKHPARMPPEQLTDEQAREPGLIKMVNGAQSTYVHPSAVAAHTASGWR